MDRRTFIGLVGVAASWSGAVLGRPRGQGVARIGYLGVRSAADGARGAAAFEDGLRALGYAPDQTYFMEYRWANGVDENLRALVSDLVLNSVELIVAPTTAAALAAQAMARDTPVVFATVGSPVELGLVASLARPGGNITGLSYYVSPAVIGKQLQFLVEIHPRIERIALMWKPSESARPLVAEATRTAALLGKSLSTFEARAPADIAPAFESMSGRRVDAVLILPDPALSEHRAVLGELALRSRLPTAVGSREDLSAGCLFSYGPSRLDLIRRAATYVDRILNGSNPADLPVEQPTKFELLVNLATAKQLDLSVPSTLLASADELIE